MKREIPKLGQIPDEVQTQMLSDQVKDIFLPNPAHQRVVKPASEIFWSCAPQA